MASDEESKESARGEDARPEAQPGEAALPSRVERALARAREAARADRERRGGRWLAAIPIGVAVLFLVLLLPRATAPESIPLPGTDLRAVRAVERADDDWVEAVGRDPLPSDILAVGRAVRALNGAGPRGVDEPGVADLRRELDAAVRDAMRGGNAVQLLTALRAVQTGLFLEALTRWERTGETSDDFFDLAAAFVERAADAGWIDGRRVVPSESERRVMFKTVWNALVGVDSIPELAITLDEKRVLYTFYFLHPRPSESHRLTLEGARRAATTPDECARANAEVRTQTELWRADKIRRLGAIDPGYPMEYALGVAYYRAGRFEASADAFASFMKAHPDGPYALRARNHLKGALVAGGSL